MDVSYKTKAIILARERLAENNSRVVVFSQDRGKLELVARGTNKLSSKLAAHVEPVTLSEIMVIHGKRQDYVGSAVGEVAYRAVKGRFETAMAASLTLQTARELIGGTEKDERIFWLLKTYLDNLESQRTLRPLTVALLQQATVFKLMALLGFAPQLQRCTACGGTLDPAALAFSPAAGGLTCGRCTSAQPAVILSPDAVKILRLYAEKPLQFLLNVTVSEAAVRQAERAVAAWREYHLG